MPNLKESVLLACIAVAYGLATDPDASLAPEPGLPKAPCPCPPGPVISAEAARPQSPTATAPTSGGPSSEDPPTAVPPDPHFGGMAGSGCVPPPCARP